MDVDRNGANFSCTPAGGGENKQPFAKVAMDLRPMYYRLEFARNPALKPLEIVHSYTIRTIRLEERPNMFFVRLDDVSPGAPKPKWYPYFHGLVMADDEAALRKEIFSKVCFEIYALSGNANLYPSLKREEGNTLG